MTEQVIKPPQVGSSWRLHPILIKTGPLFFYAVFYTLFFSPVLFTDRLLAPIDGVIQSVPSYFVTKSLWTTHLYSGFPIAADPTIEFWYPLARLFSFFHLGWNSFVISAYILASYFTFGYVNALTNSRFASFMAGLIYSMSGFMMAHLGHTSMIHASAWLPLIIWALENLKKGFTATWYFLGCLGLSFCLLAGHFQIYTFAVGLSAIYVLIGMNSSCQGRCKYLSQFIIMVILSLGLSGVQILPTLELVGQGMRAELSLEVFNQYDLPLYQIPALLFPFLYGGAPQSFYGLGYFGEWNFLEMTGYLGYLPLFLVMYSIFVCKNRPLIWVWVVVAVLAFLLALGDGTPLAQLMYALPGYSKFRAPSRHFVELSLAISVLAGLGIAAIQRGSLDKDLALKIVLGGLVIVSACLVSVHFMFDKLHQDALSKGIHLELTPWMNPAVGVPLILFILSATLFLMWNRYPDSRIKEIVLASILILDLGSCSWFLNWKYQSPIDYVLSSPGYAKKYRQSLKEKNERMIPLQGGLGILTEIPPNISWLWGVPSASGYGPLILNRYRQLMLMDAFGKVKGDLLSPKNRGLDMMAVRYLFAHSRPKFADTKFEIVWNHFNLDVSLGGECGSTTSDPIKVNLPENFEATHLGIVSSLACSVGVHENSKVLRVESRGKDGGINESFLLAGRDTAEWMHDCDNVVSQVKHSKAKVFEAIPAKGHSLPCNGYYYYATLPLSSSKHGRMLTLEKVNKQGATRIHKLTLYNEMTKKSYPLINLIDPEHFRWVERLGQTDVFENSKTLPRAWLVYDVVEEKPRDILKAVHTSKMPDGSLFDPRRTALLEEPWAGSLGPPDPQGRVAIVKMSDTMISLDTHSTSASFLILSDIYYPGWQASIDGQPTQILQTNYVLRGLQLPAGNHQVVFEYKPQSVIRGAAVSLSAIAISGVVAWAFRNKRRRERTISL